MREKNPYKKRIRVIVDILGDVIRMKNIGREALVEIVKDYYGRYKIEPLRGKALPADIYDKELASLYVIGKYGLGLDIDYPELFNKLFDKEIMFEKAINCIVNNEYDEARKILEALSPEKKVDSNTVARMLRIAFTKTILGFQSEEDFINILKKTKEAFPEEERTVRNYVRYYIAFRTAEAIAKGEIKNRVMKEAFKQALSARISFEKAIPNDDYIKDIARNVFNINENILSKALSK